MPPTKANAPQTLGKEKISDEKAEHDDVHGDVHVLHVHVSSRSKRSTDFPGRYKVLLKAEQRTVTTAEGRLTCRCFLVRGKEGIASGPDVQTNVSAGQRAL